MDINNIFSFFENIKNKVLLTFKACDFELLQLSLLEESFNIYQKKIETNLFNTSLSTFYLIIKHYKKDFDEQAELLGCFLTLYVLSLDLFDDVQDDDLAGKPYEQVGTPIAVNNALTLLFLSLQFLSQAIALEKNSQKTSQYLNVFNQASVLAVKGQHKDLMGIKVNITTKDVLEMNKEKSASMLMTAQCAAIFSNCSEESVEKYKSIAEQMVKIFQIVDDFRDIYGKKISPDLATNKVTYPIACFFENSDQNKIKKFNELKKSLPDSIKDIRELLYKSGTLTKSSETIENLRRNIHKDLVSMNATSPSIRTILYIIDGYANTIYKTPFLDESKFIFQPKGEWHTTINNSVNSFFYNMRDFHPPEKPMVLPWHLPEWMYDYKRNIVFYSDIEEQPEEIIPSHSKITGISDWSTVKNGIKLQSPFLMSHELFHFWRKQSGKITQDYWYEEWVANNLAIAYIKTFLPDLVKETQAFFAQILSNKNIKLSTKGNEITKRFFNPDYEPAPKIVGYEVDLEEMGYIQVNMANTLLNKDYSLNEVVDKFL